MTGGTGNSIYSAGVSYLPNSDLDESYDSVNGSWKYTYDDFNRLNTAVSNTGLGCAEVYDRFGNRLQQTNYTGTCMTPNYTLQTGKYWISGFSYDLAGDMIGDGIHSYQYDAEGRLASVDSGSTATYVYDAGGTRVRRIVGGVAYDDVYDLGGHVISDFLASGGTWNRGEVYAGGMHLATYENGTTYFAHSDWLGTERVRSLPSGSIFTPSLWTSYPFGEGSATPNPSPAHFTGKERDSESGNDYFGARYYASSMGRFMSPDPLPWLGWQHGNSKDRQKFAAFIGNPQSLNLYAYVNGNPVSRTDPTGLYMCSGNAQQCQALQNSLDAVKRAADTLSKGDDKDQALAKKLNGVLSFYGKAGDDNGVKVGFADLGGRAVGQTSTSFFTGKTSITFDLQAFNHGYAFGAETAAHEGAHGVDKITPFGMLSWSRVLGTETNAYGAEAAVDRGLGTATASDGNSPVWNPGWGAAGGSNSANAINANATSTAHFECGGGCFGEPQN